LNHGAIVFPHLFGFRGGVNWIFFTTPASTACSKISCSTAAALSSLFKI
jgi:hypothetical protein